MKIENILVVGANGFVGYYLVKRLLQCKYMVIGLDCNDDNISEFLEKDNYMFIKMNLFEEDFFELNWNPSFQFASLSSDLANRLHK